MLSSAIRGINRAFLCRFSTERKLVAGADYFKNIAENIDHTTKRLDDLSLDPVANIKQTDTHKAKLEQDSSDFAKKVRQNPDRFIENRRPSYMKSISNEFIVYFLVFFVYLYI
jgi:hypothetical protein